MNLIKNIEELNYLMHSQLPDVAGWSMASDCNFVTIDLDISCFDGDLIRLYMPIYPDKRGYYWLSEVEAIQTMAVREIIKDSDIEKIGKELKKIDERLDIQGNREIVIEFPEKDFLNAFNKMVSAIKMICEKYINGNN